MRGDAAGTEISLEVISVFSLNLGVWSFEAISKTATEHTKHGGCEIKPCSGGDREIQATTQQSQGLQQGMAGMARKDGWRSAGQRDNRSMG